MEESMEWEGADRESLEIVLIIYPGGE